MKNKPDTTFFKEQHENKKRFRFASTTWLVFTIVKPSGSFPRRDAYGINPSGQPDRRVNGLENSEEANFIFCAILSYEWTENSITNSCRDAYLYGSCFSIPILQ